MTAPEKTKLTPSEIPPTAEASRANSMTVVDLDRRYTRKQIKKLREGRGKLMSHISEVLQEMTEHNALPALAHPVVIVVREKDAADWGLFE
jgi:Family of unknown function (DUF6200)